MHVKVILALGLLTACGGRPSVEVPSHVISNDSMVLVLTDVHLVEGAKMGQKIIGDKRSLGMYYDKIYTKYGISKARFDSSYSFYAAHPGLMEELYRDVLDTLSIIEQAPPRTPLADPNEDAELINNNPANQQLKKRLQDSLR